MKNTYSTNFPQNRLDQLFSTGGDGSGTTNMNVAVATDFKIVASTETEMQITRILFKMRDANMRLNQFGGIATLTNGITITARDTNDAVLHTFNPLVIKSLDDFGLLAGLDSVIEPSVGDDTWYCRWTLEKAGRPIILFPAQYLMIDINDDLSGLTEFYAQAQGFTWEAGT